MKFLIILALLVPAHAWSAETQLPSNKELKKEMDFEDLLVKGKYHFSDEAVTTVEDDKILDALLEIRKDFRDRIEMSSAQN